MNITNYNYLKRDHKVLRVQPYRRITGRNADFSVK